MCKLRALSVGAIVILLLANMPALVQADAKVRVRSFVPKAQDTVPTGAFTVFNVKTQVFVMDGTITGVVYRTGFSCEVSVTWTSASQGTVSLEGVNENGFCTRLTWVIGTLVSGNETPAATLNVEATTNPTELSPAGEHTIKRQGRLNYDEGNDNFAVHDNEIVIIAE